MSNQKKEYDNPQDAAKDLLTIGGAAILNKAIRTAYKSNWQEQLADISDLEGILETVGKTL